MDMQNFPALNDEFKLGHPVAKLYKHRKVLFCFLAPFLFLFLVYFFFLRAPGNFPVGTIVKIEKGMSLRNVSLKLSQEKIIRSRLAFEAFVIFYDAELRIRYSDYLFEKKLSVYEVARRVSRGEHHMAPIAVTIPEGLDTTQIGDTFAAKLVNFNKNQFLLEAKPKEGYLFPDTYFFFNTANEEDVIEFMSENYKKKITLLLPDILKSGRNESDTIIMASIIEREAKGETDRGFISGILWKRLATGMPLQVDAAPETYKVKGLPKSPIANPGMAAIKASISPQSSPYLYYLHDKNGDIHYARTFGEHVNNKFRYLK